MDSIQPRVALIRGEPLKPLLDDLRELFNHARNLAVDFLFLGHHALSGPHAGTLRFSMTILLCLGLKSRR
jgi:hypothetical protein